MNLPVLALLLAAAPLPPAAVADAPRDAVHPAALDAFVIPAGDGAMNAVLYRASGAASHPALLLLHGFPGNEQNLDLAQAARRAGWSVLTLHYRGSWGSPGAFSFAGATEDAATALAYLRANAARLGIDARRIAIAGHSMGGIIAARTAADDKALLGAFLIDPADFAAIGRSFADPAQREAFLTGEVRGDMPPLAGTSEAALMAEIARADPRLDLVAAMPALADRPLAIVGAERGIARFGEAAGGAAKRAGARRLDVVTWPTDHSFSDMRVALAGRLVAWLAALPR